MSKDLRAPTPRGQHKIVCLHISLWIILSDQMKDPEHETCKLINDINNIKNESTKSSGRHGYVKTDKHDY